MCPCKSDNFYNGGYGSISTTDLEKFDRKEYRSTGSFDDNMMFTEPDMAGWLAIKGSASAGYTSLTKRILQYGGGDVSATSPYAWLFRIPPTVTSYQQCFESMVENKAYEDYILGLDYTDSGTNADD